MSKKNLKIQIINVKKKFKSSEHVKKEFRNFPVTKKNQVRFDL